MGRQGGPRDRTGAGDVFFEIGPGRGALTRELAARAASVTAFEIDRDLAAALREYAPAEPDDRRPATSCGPTGSSSTARDGPVRVAGNLPYNVASPILFTLIDLYSAGIPLVDATVMLQREVADRLVARPGSKEYGVLSILVQLSAEVDRLLALPPGAFRPAPKVQSALVRLRFHPPSPRPRNLETFVRARQGGVYPAAENAGERPPRIPAVGSAHRVRDPARGRHRGRRRPETLAVDELVRLADASDIPADGLPRRDGAML